MKCPEYDDIRRQFIPSHLISVKSVIIVACLRSKRVLLNLAKFSKVRDPLEARDFSTPDRLLPRVSGCGLNGKTDTTQSSFIHFTDAILSVLL